MEDVQLTLQPNGEGVFAIMDSGEQIAKMEFGIRGNIMTVYHTEVVEKAEGKGLAKKLMTAMAIYARAHALKVAPLCPYVHIKFRKHPDEYGDIWQHELPAK